MALVRNYGDGPPVAGTVVTTTGKFAPKSDGTNALAAAAYLVDSAGDPVSVGGGTQYAEDSVAASGDLGNVALTVRKDTATALAGADGDYAAMETDANGRLHVNTGEAVGAGSSSATTSRTVMAGAPTGTKSNVAAATSSTTLLAANTARRGATLWNDSTSILYVDLSGGTASATSCSVKLIADAYYEVPFWCSSLITGIWVSATGSVRVTEIT